MLAAAGRGAVTGDATDRVVVDGLDVRIAAQAGERRGRHFGREGVHLRQVDRDPPSGGRDRRACAGAGAGLERDDDASRVGGLGGRRCQARRGETEAGDDGGKQRGATGA
jgi:hypothetical protein